MKKFLVLFSALMLFVSVPIAETKKPTPDDVASIGFKILESNDIQKRMVFKHTIFIKNPRATLDYKPENVGLDSTGRVLWVYVDVLNLTDNEDELAGLLSHAIALGENSYKGVFRGFFSNFAYAINPRPKENKGTIKWQLLNVEHGKLKKVYQNLGILITKILLAIAKLKAGLKPKLKQKKH